MVGIICFKYVNVKRLIEWNIDFIMNIKGSYFNHTKKR